MSRRSLLPAWTADYRRDWLRGDVLAGVTVTAYLMPQVMAYAEVAGLPAVTGLWASVGALLAYAVLGSSRQLSVGPESTTALMTAAALGVRGHRQPPTSTPPSRPHCASWSAVICVSAGSPGSPSSPSCSPARARRLHGGRRRHHDRLPARQAHRHHRARGRVPAPSWSTSLRHLDETHGPTLVLGLVTLVAVLVGSAFAPRAPIALIGMVGAAAVTAWLDLGDRGVHRHRVDPGGAAHPDAAARRPEPGGLRAPGGARGRLRRLHRQHPHRPRVRAPPPRAHRRQAGAPRARRCEPRRRDSCTASRSAAAAAGPRSPTRWAHAPSWTGVCTVVDHGRRPALAAPRARRLPDGGPRRRRGVRRDPTRRRRRVPPARRLPTQRGAARARHDRRCAARRACSPACSSRSGSRCST